jgi:hypothetical protein
LRVEKERPGRVIASLEEQRPGKGLKKAALLAFRSVAPLLKP